MVNNGIPSYLIDPTLNPIAVSESAKARMNSDKDFLKNIIGGRFVINTALDKAMKSLVIVLPNLFN